MGYCIALEEIDDNRWECRITGRSIASPGDCHSDGFSEPSCSDFQDEDEDYNRDYDPDDDEDPDD